MSNFWSQSSNPFFILAPMEDVTDTVFREVIMSVSDASVLNVLFTEFTNIDGLLNEKGHDKVAERLIINSSERAMLKARKTKIVAQIWGSDPEKFNNVAKYLTSLNLFDGIDINMGCPVKKVVKKATCSALIQYPKLAQEIIYATKEGTDLPVSVKTRIGFKSVETDRWIPQVLETKPAALIIHGRIQKQLSSGLANWEEINKTRILRDEISSDTRIIGNGDVDSYVFGMDKIKSYQLDGVMIGRGIFKNPWIFNKTEREIDLQERVLLLKFHIELFEKSWSNKKNYNILKRFYKIYLQGFRGASSLRAALMKTSNYKEAFQVINSFSE